MNPDAGALTATERPAFRLRLLGFPSIVTTDGSPVTGLGPGKPLALLAFLAVRREARREELVDLLWGEVNEANARNAFRQALHRLRTALGEAIVPMVQDKVELVAAGGLEIDREAFLSSIDRGNIEAAADLYRGDFLDGFSLGEPVFDGWVDAERIRLKSRFQSALHSGAQSALNAGRWLEALRCVQRLTSIAPFDEAAALLEANVLVAAGRAGEATAALRRFTEGLRDQLDIPPSAKVRELIARIERADPNRQVAPKASTQREAPFVGREPEIARIMGLARRLSSEHGATLWIEGPAGIGKSRLVNEFVTRAKSLGPLLLLRGRERPAGTALPYASIAEALRGALRAPGVAGTGRHLLAEASRILPELRDSFDLPDPPPMDAEGGRLRFYEGIAALLDSAAYEQPVCIVLDDMQHGSSLTLDLVGYLGPRLQSSPVLLLMICRSDTSASNSFVKSRSPAAIDSESGEAETLCLQPLDLDATRELVEAIVAARGVAGQLEVERVAQAAQGNPLRATELARRALNGELPTTAAVSLRDILWTRLQGATPSQRRVFFAAALLSRGCSLRLLAAAAHLPELATFEAVQRLEDLDLLAQHLDSVLLAHDFTSSFVVEVSGLAGRALLAGWAADALAAEPVPPNAELAHLYSLAGQQATAFAYARRAVYDAAALGAGPDVHRLLGLALAVAPDTKSREQIEAMLLAFGAGKRLLDSPAQAKVAERFGEPIQPPPGAAAPPASAPGTARPQSPLRRARPVVTPRLAALVILGMIAVSAAVAWSKSQTVTDGPRTLRDSLLVIERGSERSENAFVVTGPLLDVEENPLDLVRRDALPTWTKSLQLPWIRPSASSAGFVAVERMTETGTDVYLMDGSPAKATPLVVGPGTDAILGWAPDGRALLIRRSRTLADGSFDADLWAYFVGTGSPSAGVPIDTSSNRIVQDEATWSPDGSRIAWVAQTGPAHQRDVFVSSADGSEAIDVTENPAEDYHISWSSDANLLSFTSDRDGNTDIFAIEFEGASRRLWRLTNSVDDEDLASFSPDHRFVAFQSTAGGDAAVYVMPALGGVPTRVTPRGGQFSIAGWRGRPASTYVDRFRIIGPSALSVGDTATLSLFASGPEGTARLPDRIIMRVSDTSIVRIGPSPGSSGRHRYLITPRRNGVAQVVATIPGWRADTLTVQIGPTALTDLFDDFSTGISPDRWMALGSPKPTAQRTAAGVGLYPNADLQWQSGILSRKVVPMAGGVDLSAVFSAPFPEMPIAGATLTLALVDAAGTVDTIAPRLTEYVAVTWDGEASRMTYSVGAQSKSDPVSSLSPERVHRVRVVISAAGEITFSVDDKPRWTASLRYLGAGSDRLARVWIGGRATGSKGSIRDLRLTSR